ncbi:MAG: heparan-alpha-glucosaminide N-acetyltransferase, partial [Caldimonas sp.]
PRASSRAPSAAKAPSAAAATAPTAASAAGRAVRFDRLDALRGVAIVWMAAFHFCFDLNHFGFIRQDFYVDPFWTAQRACIVTLFMACVGAGQAIASAQHQSWPRFWRRWVQIAGCAVLVSLGSWWMFPRSYISFGVLHGIAVMLVVARLTSSWGAWRWPLGLVAIALPHLVAHPFFDTRWTNWIGLVTQLPVTEDFAPILPWLGVVWWGAAATDWLLAHRPAVLTDPLPRLARPLVVLGRWSLSFYMLHQPVLIGLLSLIVALRR